MTFKYDPFGRRIQKSSGSGTTNFLYDGLTVIEELDGTGNTLARYAQGVGLDEPLAELRAATTSFYEDDGMGSITSLSNTTGAVANTYVYDSFGNLTVSTGTLTNPFQYTGRDFDKETGLYYNRARYYDPTVGRFLSEDPIGFGGGLNFYVYAENDPIDSEDPFGLRDIIVVIWNQLGSSVGHAAAFELNGDSILSQFPKCYIAERCPTGKNETLPWSTTREREDRAPTHVFRVHVPNDAPFDKVAKNHRDRPLWNWYPTWIDVNETNCVYSVGKALSAGGVPVGDYDWPGNLGDDLSGKTNAKGQPWNVTELPNVPWQPPAKK